MRGLGLNAAIAVILFGCAPEERAQDARRTEAAAASTAPAPGPKDVSIPAAFHGRYDSSREACGRPGDGRLQVSAGELRFHESIGTVRKVARQQSGAIRVEADYQGEGESWRSVRELGLSADGAALTVSGDGSNMVRVRCPEDEL